MGMLLRVVEEDKVQARVDARLSDEEFNEVVNILEESSEDGDSPSAKRLKNRLRKKGDVYAWGIEEDVYGDVMDGDPMVVAVGSGDDPSDYEIKYVTELEFCLHKDVCEGCGEDVSDCIGFDGKYVAFSTIPPVDVPDESDEKRTLDYVEERLESDKNNLKSEDGVLRDRYIRDTEFSRVDNKEEPIVSDGLINDILNLSSEQIPTEVLVWTIGSYVRNKNEPDEDFWNEKEPPDCAKFPETNVAYGDARREEENEYFRAENFPGMVKRPLGIGDIFIAKHGSKSINGFGLVRTDWYKRKETEIEVKREYVRGVNWIVNFKEKIKINEPMLDSGGVFSAHSTFQSCNIKEEDNWEKHEYLREKVLDKCNNGKKSKLETEFNKLEQKAKHKRVLRQKLEEHRMKHNEIKEYRDLLEDKKQVLFYGPPGTGKTHTAEKIPDVIDKYDEDRTEFVTFHPSYSYEEFVQGIRPVTDSSDEDDDDNEDDENNEDDEKDELSYKVKKGVFKDLCKRARKPENSDNNYLLVIDEVNRGNISSIFGELITLLEEDKRGDPENGGEEATKVSLPYSDHEDDDEEDFWVPDNLHIIGTMNTADRSIAKLDVALRRRFAHVPFEPDIKELAEEEFEDDYEKFKKSEEYDERNSDLATEFLEQKADLDEENSKEADPVALSALAIQEINERLMDDEFGVEAGKKIGHSYMMDMNGEEDVEKTVERAWKYEILPLLNEYFFDQYDEIAELLDDEDEVIVDTDMKRFEKLEDLDWDSDSDDDLKSVLEGLADEGGSD